MVFIHIYVDEYLWVQIHIELDLGIDSNIKKSVIIIVNCRGVNIRMLKELYKSL